MPIPHALRPFLALLLALGCAVAQAAQTYHVAQSDPVASDGNAGTLSEPWLTIQHAAETLQAGDTVIVHAGVYRETAAAFAPYDAVIRPRVSGTASEPIHYLAAPGENVVIDPQNGGPGFYLFFRDHLIIEGFEIRNARIGGIWVTVDGATDIQVLNNHIHNVSAKANVEPEDRDNIGGIRLDGCSGCLVRGNIIHNVEVPPNVGNGRPENAAGVLSFDMEDTVIEQNTIYQVYNGVMHKRSTGNPGVKIRRNLMHDVTTGVYYVHAGSGDPPHREQYVEQNHIYDCDFGIYANVRDSVTPSRGFYFRHNTLRCDFGIRLRAAQNVHITGNLIQADTYSIAIRPSPERPTMIMESDYNVYAPTGRFIEGENDQNPPAAPDYPSLASWQQTSGLDEHSAEGAAALRPDASDQAWLQPTSSARNAAENQTDAGAHPNGGQPLGHVQARPSPPTSVQIDFAQ